jgi:hypothetical protein
VTLLHHSRSVQRRSSALVLYVLTDADHDMVHFSRQLGKLLEPSNSREPNDAIAWLESVTVVVHYIAVPDSRGTMGSPRHFREIALSVYGKVCTTISVTL